MIRNLLLSLFLILASCGTEGDNTNWKESDTRGYLPTQVVHVGLDYIHSEFGNHDGYATWKVDGAGNIVSCRIYMPFKDELPSIYNYMYLLGHEMRHCLEGAFHE